MTAAAGYPNALFLISGISKGWLTVIQSLIALWALSALVGAIINVRLRYWQKELAKRTTTSFDKARAEHGDVIRIEEHTLWDAIGLLEGGRHWIQGGIYNQGNRCLIGAIGNIQSLGELDIYTKLRDDPRAEAVADAIVEQFPDRLSYTAYDNIERLWQFNDAPSTHFEDVRLVLEKAAIKMDEVL